MAFCVFQSAKTAYLVILPSKSKLTKYPFILNGSLLSKIQNRRVVHYRSSQMETPKTISALARNEEPKPMYTCADTCFITTCGLFPIR